MRYCPNIDSTGSKGKKDAPNVLKYDAPTKRRVYALQTRGEKSYGGENDEGKSLLFHVSDMISF